MNNGDSREAQPFPPATLDPNPTVFQTLQRRVSESINRPSKPAPSPSPPVTPRATPEHYNDTGSDPHPADDPPSAEAVKQTLHDKSSGSRRRISRYSNLNPQLILVNNGSVARDHLASERTFLAYVRTSLAVASAGVALVQLFTVASNTTNNSQTVFTPAAKRLHAYARPLGATTVVFAMVLLAVGFYRYFLIQHALKKGMFPASRIGVAGITIVLLVITGVVFGLLVAGR